MGETRVRRKGRNSAARVPTRQPDYRHLRHPFLPQSVFSEDEVQSLHDTALRVLQELGMKILLPEARDIFAAAGARVDGEMVYIGSDIVEAALKTAPPSIRLRAGTPDRDQIYEDGTMLFMAGAGCPNVTDRERGRRPGSREAFRESLKLCQSRNPKQSPRQNRNLCPKSRNRSKRRPNRSGKPSLCGRRRTRMCAKATPNRRGARGTCL